MTSIDDGQNESACEQRDDVRTYAPRPSFNPLARLQAKPGICEYLGGIEERTYDQWVQRGLVPGPVPGTRRYDVKAHDSLLDRAQGLTAAAPGTRSALGEWREAKHAPAA